MRSLHGYVNVYIYNPRNFGKLNQVTPVKGRDMSAKKILASVITAATLSATVVPAAQAQSSSSSAPSGPADWTVEQAEENGFQMGEAGNTSSGSSVLDVSLVAAGITTAVAAVGAGIAVLSPAVDAEQILRDMGQPQLADQVRDLRASLGIQ